MKKLAAFCLLLVITLPPVAEPQVSAGQNSPIAKARFSGNQFTMSGDMTGTF